MHDLLYARLQKQAMWLDITKGKFQLTEWHTIAEEWFKQKPRSSDQVYIYNYKSAFHTCTVHALYPPLPP